jgi:hypothetical protein
MPYVGKKPADIIATAVDTTTGTFSGEVDAASLDISGDIDVDGTTNLDVVDIDGAVDMASTLIVNDSVTFQSSGSSKPVLTLKNTNADTTPPSITFQKDSSSPADNDEVANINFYGDDDGGSVAAYANLKVVSTDVSNGSEDGKMTIKTMVGGTLRNKLDITSSEVVINEDSIDSDFRVESDNNTHALFVQGSDGNVGIGTSSPSYGISVQSATDTSASGSFKRTSGSEIRILPQGVQANIGTYTNHPLVFNTNSTERMAIDVNGHVTMPYQPSFLARPSSRQSNLAINTTHTIAFGTEVFDRGADFASSTFTAPIEGLYQLNVQLLIQQMDSATDYYYINLKTSNRNYDQYWDNDDKAGDNSNGAGVSIVVLADMDAGDTAFVQIIVPNSGSAQMDVETASAFSGFLAC